MHSQFTQNETEEISGFGKLITIEKQTKYERRPHDVRFDDDELEKLFSAQALRNRDWMFSLLEITIFLFLVSFFPIFGTLQIAAVIVMILVAIVTVCFRKKLKTVVEILLYLNWMFVISLIMISCSDNQEVDFCQALEENPFPYFQLMAMATIGLIFIMFDTFYGTVISVVSTGIVGGLSIIFKDESVDAGIWPHVGTVFGVFVACFFIRLGLDMGLRQYFWVSYLIWKDHRSASTRSARNPTDIRLTSGNNTNNGNNTANAHNSSSSNHMNISFNRSFFGTKTDPVRIINVPEEIMVNVEDTERCKDITGGSNPVYKGTVDNGKQTVIIQTLPLPESFLNEKTEGNSTNSPPETTYSLKLPHGLIAFINSLLRTTSRSTRMGSLVGLTTLSTEIGKAPDILGVVYDLPTNIQPATSLFETREDYTIPPKTVLPTLYQLARGLKVLHDSNLAHGNISLNNIAIELSPLGSKVVLANVGLYYVTESLRMGGISDDLPSTKYITHDYLQGAKPAFDVYAFGMVIYHLICGEDPLKVLKDELILENTIEVNELDEESVDHEAMAHMFEGYRPFVPEPVRHVHPRLTRLMEQCWSENVNNRPSIESLCSRLRAIHSHYSGENRSNRNRENRENRENKEYNRSRRDDEMSHVSRNSHRSSHNHHRQSSQNSNRQQLDRGYSTNSVTSRVTHNTSTVVTAPDELLQASPVPQQQNGRSHQQQGIRYINSHGQLQNLHANQSQQQQQQYNNHHQQQQQQPSADHYDQQQMHYNTQDPYYAPTLSDQEYAHRMSVDAPRSVVTTISQPRSIPSPHPRQSEAMKYQQQQEYALQVQIPPSSATSQISNGGLYGPSPMSHHQQQHHGFDMRAPSPIMPPRSNKAEVPLSMNAFPHDPLKPTFHRSIEKNLDSEAHEKKKKNSHSRNGQERLQEQKTKKLIHINEPIGFQAVKEQQYQQQQQQQIPDNNGEVGEDIIDTDDVFMSVQESADFFDPISNSYSFQEQHRTHETNIGLDFDAFDEESRLTQLNSEDILLQQQHHHQQQQQQQQVPSLNRMESIESHTNNNKTQSVEDIENEDKKQQQQQENQDEQQRSSSNASPQTPAPTVSIQEPESKKKTNTQQIVGDVIIPSNAPSSKPTEPTEAFPTIIEQNNANSNNDYYPRISPIVHTTANNTKRLIFDDSNKMLKPTMTADETSDSYVLQSHNHNHNHHHHNNKHSRQEQHQQQQRKAPIMPTNVVNNGLGRVNSDLQFQRQFEEMKRQEIQMQQLQEKQRYIQQQQQQQQQHQQYGNYSNGGDVGFDMRDISPIVKPISSANTPSVISHGGASTGGGNHHYQQFEEQYYQQQQQQHQQQQQYYNQQHDMVMGDEYQYHDQRHAAQQQQQQHQQQQYAYNHQHGQGFNYHDDNIDARSAVSGTTVTHATHATGTGGANNNNNTSKPSNRRPSVTRPRHKKKKYQRPKMLADGSWVFGEHALGLQWLVQMNEVEVSKVIGQGQSGSVYKGSYRGRPVAIKKLCTLNEIDDDNQWKQLHQEISVLTRLNHPNLMGLAGVVSRPPDLCILMELAERGNLTDVLHSKAQLTWLRRLDFAADAIKGLGVLHRQDPPILHRDCKSMNLMVFRDYTLKVSDFGFSRIYTSTSKMSYCGSPAWVAPEIAKGCTQYNTAVDIYSYGVVLWELCARTAPYSNETNVLELLKKIIEGIRPPLPKGNQLPPAPIDEKMINLMQMCWAAEPSERPSADEVLAEVINMKKLLKDQQEDEQTNN